MNQGVGSTGIKPPLIEAIVTSIFASLNSKYGMLSSDSNKPVGAPTVSFGLLRTPWLVAIIRAFLLLKLRTV